MPKKIVDKDTGEIRELNEFENQDAVNYNTTEGYEPIYWKTPWNHNRDAESARTACTCPDKSKTQQQFAAESDINNILRKFTETGELALTGQPKYADLEQEFDLQDQMVTAYQVQEAWDKLPAAVRNILKDPKMLVDYVHHCLERGDLDPLRELGLAHKLPEPQTPKGGTPAPLPEEKAPEGLKTPPPGAQSDTK